MNFSIKHRKKFLYFYIVLALICWGGIIYGTNLAKSLILLSSVVLIIKSRNIRFSKELFLVLSIFLAWSLAQIIKYNELVFFISYFCYIIFAYFIVKIYKKRLFYYFELVMADFGIISLVSWLFILVFPNFADILKFFFPIAIDGTLEATAIIFNVADSFEVLRRNTGFASEPGKFASFLSLALLFNLYRNKFSIKENKNFWILFIALLSSQSTTGYAILLIIIASYVANKKTTPFTKVAFASMAIALSILLVIAAPFFGEKIKKLFVVDADDFYGKLKDTEYIADHEEMDAIVPQRFEGLVLEALNIYQDPLLGCGEWERSFLRNALVLRIYPVNGVLKIFTIFGIFMGIAYYYCLVKSSKYINTIFNAKGWLGTFLVFFSINISYAYFFNHLFMSFAFFALFDKKNSLAERFL